MMIASLHSIPRDVECLAQEVMMVEKRQSQLPSLMAGILAQRSASYVLPSGCRLARRAGLVRPSMRFVWAETKLHLFVCPARRKFETLTSKVTTANYAASFGPPHPAR